MLSRGRLALVLFWGLVPAIAVPSALAGDVEDTRRDACAQARKLGITLPYCSNTSSGASSRLPPKGFERRRGGPRQCDAAEARINVDWVLFRDRGAQKRYRKFLALGMSPFDAVVTAQAHNPPVQELLRRCRSWTTAYLGQFIQPPTVRRPSRQACKCVGVYPTGTTSPLGNPRYRVTNNPRCGALGISVLFKGSSLYWPGRLLLASWSKAGEMASGEQRFVYAPGWRFVTIAGVRVSNAGGSRTCRFL